MSLQLTSCLFGTITVHAFYVRRYIMGLMWLIQSYVSIIHHANHANPRSYNIGYYILFIDRIVANSNWLYAAWRGVNLSPHIVCSWVVWTSLIYVFMIYYMFLYHSDISSYSPPYNPIVVRAHKSLHITSTIGIHALLLADILPSTMAY